MSLPDDIVTDRLRLPLISYDEAARARAGQRHRDWHPDYPRKDDFDAMSMIRESPDPWGPRHIVRAVGNLYIGSIGLFGPPVESEDGVLETEVGYGLVQDARGRGVATEALRGLLKAIDERAQVRLRASIEPDNRASLRVVAKCGFTELRGANEDGLLVMARPASRSADQ